MKIRKMQFFDMQSGIGKALLGALEKQAKERRCTQIILVTEENRKDACRFYEANGYQEDNAAIIKNYEG